MVLCQKVNDRILLVDLDLDLPLVMMLEGGFLGFLGLGGIVLLKVIILIQLGIVSVIRVLVGDRGGMLFLKVFRDGGGALMELVHEVSLKRGAVLSLLTSEGVVGRGPS